MFFGFFLEHNDTKYRCWNPKETCTWLSRQLGSRVIPCCLVSWLLGKPAPCSLTALLVSVESSSKWMLEYWGKYWSIWARTCQVARCQNQYQYCYWCIPTVRAQHGHYTAAYRVPSVGAVKAIAGIASRRFYHWAESQLIHRANLEEYLYSSQWRCGWQVHVQPGN